MSLGDVGLVVVSFIVDSLKTPKIFGWILFAVVMGYMIWKGIEEILDQV